MKIALLTEYDQIGGGESNLLELASELGIDNEVTLFCPAGPVLDSAVSRGIRTRPIRMGLKKGWYSFMPVPGFDGPLLRDLAEHDIVHSYSLNLLPRLFPLRSRPLVWTVHGFWEKPNGLRARIIDAFVRHVIPVSSDVDRIASFPSAKKTMIPLGTRLGTPAEAEKPFDPLHVNLASVGRFQRIKGQDLLLRAAAKTAESLPGVRFDLHIVGDVNGNESEDLHYKEELLELAGQCRRGNLFITFEGRRKNVADYYDRADLVIIPSRYESFSMVAIEALSRGRPVLGPDIGGPKEILKDPAAGRLFRAGDSDCLAEAIVSALADYPTFQPKASLALAAGYSIATQAERHQQLYRTLIP